MSLSQSVRVHAGLWLVDKGYENEVPCRVLITFSVTHKTLCANDWGLADTLNIIISTKNISKLSGRACEWWQGCVTCILPDRQSGDPLLHSATSGHNLNRVKAKTILYPHISLWFSLYQGRVANPTIDSVVKRLRLSSVFCADASFSLVSEFQ